MLVNITHMETIKLRFIQSNEIKYFFNDYYENISLLLHKKLEHNFHQIYYGNIANIEEIKNFI